MRTIELHINYEDLRVLTAGTNDGAVFKALNYLTTWGMDGYTTVKIYRDGRDMDLIAVYSSDTYSPFTLGAVYDTKAGTYSFHS